MQAVHGVRRPLPLQPSPEGGWGALAAVYSLVFGATEEVLPERFAGPRA